MDVICANCSRPNPENSVFCVGCGNRLPQKQQGQTQGTNATLPTLSSQNASPTHITPQPQFGTTSTYVSQNGGPSATSLPQYSTGTNPPTYAPAGPPAMQPYTPGNPTPSAPPSPTQWSSAAVAPPPPASQFGSTQGLASIRRAFAGHGTLIMHHSWLLPGDHSQTMAVRHQIQTKVEQRQIASLLMAPGKLMERGVLMEERDYLIAKRDVATVFIYAAPAGNDLYISRATTVLPRVSNVRVVIAAAFFLLMLSGFFYHPSSSSSFTVDAASLIIAGLLGTLGVFIFLIFVVLLVFSFIHWLLEKDFLVLLRPRSLNDFQLDDIMLLEHVTDDVVHSAVEQLGLDASKIAPPPTGYHPKQRIRAI